MTLHIIKKCKLNYKKYNNILNIKIKIFFNYGYIWNLKILKTYICYVLFL